MPKSKKIKKPHQPAYLTKRVLVSAVSKGVKKAAGQTLATMGFVIIAHDGWIVKRLADGTIEQIEKIDQPATLSFGLD